MEICLFTGILNNSYPKMCINYSPKWPSDLFPAQHAIAELQLLNYNYKKRQVVKFQRILNLLVFSNKGKIIVNVESKPRTRE